MGHMKEELMRIKTMMNLNESESDEDFIVEYKKNFDIAKKLEKHLVKFLKQTFEDDKLYDIRTEIKRVCFASIDSNGELYCDERLVIILEFIDLNYGEGRNIRSMVFDYIKKIVPFDLFKYGSPIDLEFFNYTKKQF